MQIQLKTTQLESISLRDTDETVEDMDFAYTPAFSDIALNKFIIRFDLKLSPEEGRLLEMSYVAYFEVDEDIKDKKDKFFFINAPAIAYPFLRAYVANFMTSSGYAPIMLQTINFVALNQSSMEATKAAEKED